MAMSYTVGNWTVESHEVDSISSTKNVVVPDLDYAHDYSVVDGTSSEVNLLNTSGTALEPVEHMRFAREKVNDIYRKLPTLKIAQLPSPVGIRLLQENIFILSADNSVSGEELSVPIRVWTCMETSTHNAITGQALEWALKRHQASLYATGTTDSTMLVRMARGDLNPTI